MASVQVRIVKDLAFAHVFLDDNQKKRILWVASRFFHPSELGAGKRVHIVDGKGDALRSGVAN